MTQNVEQFLKEQKRNAPFNLKIGAKNVLICIPGDLYENMNVRCAMFCCKLAGRGLIDMRSMPGRTAEITRNRFLKDLMTEEAYFKYTHVFWLDADTIPTNEFIIDKFLQMKKPVICGVTPVFDKNRQEYRWPIIRYGDETAKLLDGKYNEKTLAATSQKRKFELDREIAVLEEKILRIPAGELPDKPFRVHRCGGTTMLMERRVFETMINDWYDKLQKEDFDGARYPWQLTLYGADGKSTLSEDYYFCDSIRRMGFEIWVDPREWCDHSQVNGLLQYCNERAIETAQGIFEDAKRTGNLALIEAA